MNEPVPPIATAMKPALVKKRPVSNCSDMIGATAMPPIAPIIAVRPKLMRVRRATSTPTTRAAVGFSAQATSARPVAVRLRRYQVPRMTTVAIAAIHSPCEGMRTPRSSIGRSPEKGGTA